MLSSNDRVAAVVDAGVEKATEHKFKLIELIKLPMQRILRIVLIIQGSEMGLTDYTDFDNRLETVCVVYNFEMLVTVYIKKSPT